MTAKTVKVLLIEDEAFDVERIKNTIKPVEARIKIRDVVAEGRAALELMKNNPGSYDVVIMDYQIAGNLKGEALIREMKRVDPTIQIIVVTKMTIDVTDFEFANKLLEAGAIWYCTKYPGDIENTIYQPTDFILNIYNAYEKRELEKSRAQTEGKLNKSIEGVLQKNRIIGESESILRMKETISQCLNLDTNILLIGESGTGKELVATNIHYQGDRRFESFIPVNCGSLPDHLIESELFGFEKGSFTGASKKKSGLFELADHGTIFLDEITEIPVSIQSTLLRVLQEGEIDKIGRTNKIRVDVRVICATNRDLKFEVKEKRFREDLFYRLNVVTIELPPLRKRQSDIPILVNHFLQQFSVDMNRSLPEIEKQAMRLLEQYSWPGNVRELENVVQRMLFFGVPLVNETHIRSALGLSESGKTNGPDGALDFDRDNILPLRNMEKQFRRQYFMFVRENTFSDASAARKLGIAPSNYHRMCKELGLK